jgi:AcrR family transcriptional regulator
MIPTKRHYNSSRRKAQADETRRGIVAAAYRLFSERGYSGTTIESIAEEAGVAAETVYAAFGNKRAILTRLIDVSVVGDEAPIPLLERPGPKAVEREVDQHRQVQMFAHEIREIMGRMSPIFEIMRIAAKTEPEVAGLLQRLLTGRMEGMAHFIRHLAANGPLRPGLGQPEATETVWALTSAEVYRLLTVDRGWSPERYEEWLVKTLMAVLLS